MRAGLVARLLGVGGIVCVLAGAADAARIAVTRPEKAAYYAGGHRFDATWEVDIPLMFVGVVVLSLAGWSTVRLRRL